MKTSVVLLFLSFGFLTGYSQNDAVKLNFHPFYGSDSLVLNKFYYSDNDSIYISKLKFYITDIVFLNKDARVFKPGIESYLLDLENKMHIDFTIDKLPDFDAIMFNIGVDSLTNVSGAMGGDLDPVHGMYWTWQSGYINFKLEGTNSRIKSAKNGFQLHIGGYAFPHKTLKTLKFYTGKKSKIDILIDIQKLVSLIELNDTYTIMSPGKSAVLVANQFSEIFKMINE